MDDEGEDMSRRRRMTVKSESFTKTRTTCATPRHQWRSISWSTHHTSPAESSESGNGIGEETDSDGETHNLCPPLESLSVSTTPQESGVKKVFRKGKNCLDVKLDLGIIEKSVPEEGEENQCVADSDTHQQEKVIPEKDKHCTQILSHLFMGGRSVAQNYAILRSFRITHILNCVGFCCPEYYPEEFTYKTLWLHDTPSEDIICVLYDVFDFLEHVREQAGCQVLVHCSEGISRSAALVIAYIMWHDHKTYEQAFEQVKALRASTNPNLGFIFQLMQWQPRILNPPKQLPSMYRIAPQSAYDPLFLVPKLVANPCLQSMDSRGPFVVEALNKLYVWKGRSCDKTMLAAADRVAFQLIRYEHAHGPIVTVAEGSEPQALLEVLIIGGSSVCTDCAGSCSSLGHEKRVSIYDMDYEIYTKACMGKLSLPLRSPHVESNRKV